MAKKYTRVIHWFRRDLRLTDNTALLAACKASEEVIPVYILSDWTKEHPWTGPKRQSFLCQCLESLSKNIEHLQGTLVIREGEALTEITQLMRETDAEAVYFNQDVDPFGKNIETQLVKHLDISVHSYQDSYLHGPDDVLKGDGTPYRVYTPFSKRWLPLPKASPAGKPKALGSSITIKSRPLPTLKHWQLGDASSDIVDGGEKAARSRMRKALSSSISKYDSLRDIPSASGTSRLSQDLRWGTISVRELYQKALSYESPQYLKELAWREFYFQILHHFPEVLHDEFNPDWRGLPWFAPDEKFGAFKKGETGFPIVDAGIRELLSTGFMHNRVRMIVAMFLTKDLHLDWRLGEQFFMQHLVDGEIASNNGGWQWSAGTGADAAPYFRIQNPWSQTKRYDPKGDYIRTWIPELANVPDKRLHAPPDDGLPIAKGYPAPILNHAKERLVTLALFKKHREAQT